MKSSHGTMSPMTKPSDLYIMYTCRPTFTANASPNSAAAAAKATNGGDELRRGSTPSAAAAAADVRLAEAHVASQLAYCGRGNFYYGGPQAAGRHANSGSQYDSVSVNSFDLLNESCTSISSTTPLHRPQRSGKSYDL